MEKNNKKGEETERSRPMSLYLSFNIAFYYQQRSIQTSYHFLTSEALTSTSPKYLLNLVFSNSQFYKVRTPKEKKNLLKKIIFVQEFTKIAEIC